MKTIRKLLIIMTILIYFIKSNIDYVNNFDVDEFNAMFPAGNLIDLEALMEENAEIARKALDSSLNFE